MFEINEPFEPVGQAYVDLLALCAEYEVVVNLFRPDSGSVDQSSPYSSILATLDALGATHDFVQETITTSWGPGAQFERMQVHLTPTCCDLLLHMPHYLYCWTVPQLWEDLCLTRRDGSLLLGSIGHELTWWLSLNRSEMLSFRQLINKQRKILHHSGIAMESGSDGRITWWGHAASIVRACKSIVRIGNVDSCNNTHATNRIYYERLLPGLLTDQRECLAGIVLNAIDRLFISREVGITLIRPEDIWMAPSNLLQVFVDLGDKMRSGAEIRKQVALQGHSS